MLEIDGSFGEGGGQVLRTSLALSLITGTPFRITDIRSRRAKPGLRRQHLTAVRAAAQIGRAEVKGDEVNSRELIFSPGIVKGGHYEFHIGTAGSTTLVFQTILLPLLLCGSESRILLTGGTHNHGGPPWDFLNAVYLPVLRRMGADVHARLDRHGFAPGAGGRWTAAIRPSKLTPLHLHERGRMRHGEVRALVSNLPISIADRELTVTAEALASKLWAFEAAEVSADGPGNIIMISAEFGHISEMATGFGQRGVPAEKVASGAVAAWQHYERSAVPVGEHLADQLMLPLALAGGGSFSTVRPTLHAHTNAVTIGRFLNAKFELGESADSAWRIAV